MRVAGTAVFLTIDPDGVPHALLNNLEHNSVLHERVVFVNVTIRDVPWVPPERTRDGHTAGSPVLQVSSTTASRTRSICRRRSGLRGARIVD